VDAAIGKLQSITIDDAPFITVDVREGGDLFCKVTYQGEPEGLRRAKRGSRAFSLIDDVALVSIENGIHSTIGYHFDTGLPAGTRADEPSDALLPLTHIFQKILGFTSDPSLGPVARPANGVDSIADDEEGEARPT
jgi:hypothetical protein